jgi:hypothetical protein
LPRALPIGRIGRSCKSSKCLQAVVDKMIE